MKVIILCGGQGTRMREETEFRPKPMVEIGGRPILWHIMRLYATHGFKEFVLCLGHKGWQIKEYFLNYKPFTCDFTLQLGFDRAIEFHSPNSSASHSQDDWRVTFAETGSSTMTGARIKRIATYMNDQDFMVTYGDGVADIDLAKLYRYHLSHGKIGTVTAVSSPGRFGEVLLDGDRRVRQFSEKPSGAALISGGFFVFRKEFLEYLSDEPGCVLEREPLERLADDGQLMAYPHEGFWYAMDTYREYQYLNSLWDQNIAPWKIWG